MLTRYAYKTERPILYNNVNTESLYGKYIDTADVAKVDGFRRILAGSFLTNSGRILPRAKIISPYTSGATSVIVSNPWAFKIGDVLRVIGTPSSTPKQEADAVIGATAAAFGTVTAIASSSGNQITTATVASPAVGNIFTLNIDGITVSYTATTTTAADVVTNLKTLFESQKSQTSTWADIDTTVASATLTFTQRYPREIFVVTGTVAQGAGGSTGTITIAVTTSIGSLAITPTGSNGNQVISTKIGTITDIPLGVITHEHYLTDEEGQDRGEAIACYNMAAVNLLALPYIDGHIVASLPRISYMPVYTGE